MVMKYLFLDRWRKWSDKPSKVKQIYWKNGYLKIYLIRETYEPSYVQKNARTECKIQIQKH